MIQKNNMIAQIMVKNAHVKKTGSAVVMESVNSNVLVLIVFAIIN